MVGTCTAHWTFLTRGMAFMVGLLLLLWSGIGHAAEAGIVLCATDVASEKAEVGVSRTASLMVRYTSAV
jgi:hypothetical protein